MIVQEANGQITSYNLDAVLRLGVFAIMSPVVKDGFVLLQAMLIAILSGCMCAGLLVLHGAGIFPVRSSSVRPSVQKISLSTGPSVCPTFAHLPLFPRQSNHPFEGDPRSERQERDGVHLLWRYPELPVLVRRDSNLTHVTAFWPMRTSSCTSPASSTPA